MKHIWHRVAVTALTLVICTAGGVMAQDSQPTIAELKQELERIELLAKIEAEKAKIDAEKKKLLAPDPALAAAEARAKEAELAAKTAESEAKVAAAALPVTTATALEGNLTVDDKVLIESETLAYQSLATLASRIADDVRAAVPATPGTPAVGGAAAVPTIRPNVLIYNQTDIAALTAFRAYVGQMNVLGNAFTQVARTGPTSHILAALPVATAVVKSVVDLVALFRTNTEVEGVPMTLDELALISEVAGNLASSHAVYVSQLYPLEAVGGGALAGQQVQTLLIDNSRKAADAQARVKALPESTDQEKAVKAEHVERLKALTTILAGYEAALTKHTAESGASLATLIKGEALEALTKDGPVLYVKVLKAGGSNRVRKNLFTGSKLSHSGGAIVNYILFNKDGSITRSKTLADYAPYQEMAAYRTPHKVKQNAGAE